MTAPMLQVLVPVRGDARFLATALDSLRAQAFTDWQATLCPLDDPAHAAATTSTAIDPRLVAFSGIQIACIKVERRCDQGFGRSETSRHHEQPAAGNEFFNITLFILEPKKNNRAIIIKMLAEPGMFGMAWQSGVNDFFDRGMAFEPFRQDL